MKILRKSKLLSLLLFLVIIIFVVILSNNFQKLPDDDQIKKLFGSQSGKEFISYEVEYKIPYVRFNDKDNNRECKVSLIKDYKIGFFTGDWIFGQDWWCSK